jgi:deoxyribonucleoside regulator
MDYAQKANIAIFTVGQFGEDNALIHAGYLSGFPQKKLDEAGAVGDVCSHFIDERGNLCDTGLDERTIGLSLEDLKKKDYRIAVAIGQKKIRSICGSLNGGYVNVLITDEDTAHGVIARLDKLESRT